MAGALRAQLVGVAATGLSESYYYNEHGIRVRKVSNGATTLYPFAHYEVENGVIVKYYFFGAPRGHPRVAMKRGTGALTYLHQDHLSSTALSTTSSGAFDVGQGYRGYGNYRTGGSLPTEHRFTGQKLDIATGLMYYNARYYDRAIGHFVSPDTLVPDPTSVWDYNRFMYVRGNPLKYSDPSGHQACDNDWCWQNRWYNAHGYFWDGNSGHWSTRQDPTFADLHILNDTMNEAGIEFDAASPWLRNQMEAIATGVVRLSHALNRGMNRLRDLLGPGVRLYLSSAPASCFGGAACALPARPVHGRYPVHFDSNQIGDVGVQGLAYTAVHELAHVMDWHSGRAFSNHWNQPPLTNYAACTWTSTPGCGLPTRERWAEAVTYFVFGEAYAIWQGRDEGRGVVLQPDLIQLQVDMMDSLLNP